MPKKGADRFKVRKGFDITLLGDAELVRAMEVLEIKFQRKWLKKEMRKGFNVTLRAVKRSTPWPKLRRTWKLRLNKRVRRGNVGYRIFGGSRQELDIPPPGAVGSRGGRGTGYWPMSQETGWRQWRGRKIPGKRFLRDPLKETKGKVFAAIRTGLWSAVRSDAGRLARRKGL